MRCNLRFWILGLLLLSGCWGGGGLNYAIHSQLGADPRVSAINSNYKTPGFNHFVASSEGGKNTALFNTKNPLPDFLPPKGAGKKACDKRGKRKSRLPLKIEEFQFDCSIEEGKKKFEGYLKDEIDNLNLTLLTMLIAVKAEFKRNEKQMRQVPREIILAASKKRKAKRLKALRLRGEMAVLRRKLRAMGRVEDDVAKIVQSAKSGSVLEGDVAAAREKIKKYEEDYELDFSVFPTAQQASVRTINAHRLTATKTLLNDIVAKEGALKELPDDTPAEFAEPPAWDRDRFEEAVIDLYESRPKSVREETKEMREDFNVAWKRLNESAKDIGWTLDEADSVDLLETSLKGKHDASARKLAESLFEDMKASSSAQKNPKLWRALKFFRKSSNLGRSSDLEQSIEALSGDVGKAAKENSDLKKAEEELCKDSFLGSVFHFVTFSRFRKKCSLQTETMRVLSEGSEEEHAKLLMLHSLLIRRHHLKYSRAVDTRLKEKDPRTWKKVLDDYQDYRQSVKDLLQHIEDISAGLRLLLEMNPDCESEQALGIDHCNVQLIGSFLGSDELHRLNTSVRDITGYLRGAKTKRSADGPRLTPHQEKFFKDKEARENFEKDMLRLINAERAKHAELTGKDLKPLTLNPKLTQAAKKHSQNMKKTRTMEHVIGGSTLASRAHTEGYSGRVLENIAAGPVDAESVMACWMDSPGHKANILDPNITHVGVARSGDYWTQVFGGK